MNLSGFLDQEKRGFVRNLSGHPGQPAGTPDLGECFIGGAIGIVMGIVVTANIGGPAPLFGLLFIGIAIFSMVIGVSKASGYRNAENAFSSRRNDIIRRIEEVRRN